MKQPSLFEQPKDAPSVREVNAARVAALKAEHDIYSHGLRDGGKMDWMAFPFGVAKEWLKGYDLTEDEKKDGFQLFAGYCRLIEEASLMADHMPTELAAVEAAVALKKMFTCE